MTLPRGPSAAMEFAVHKRLGARPSLSQPITCCCFHPTRPHLYLATGCRVLEYDLVSGDVLGARSEELEVTSLHCSSAQNCVVALLQERYVRVYKELSLHGGNGLRPVLKHRCTSQKKDHERVGSSALSQGSRATFFFSKKGRPNIYAIDALADESACEIVKVPGAKKALKTEPTELICHPSKPLFVAVSESAAIVGNLAEMSFALEGSEGSRLHSLDFHPTLSRMVGIRGSEILCWDVSNSLGFRLLASVQTAAPPEGVHFLPGTSPYFCSFGIDKTTGPAWRCEVSPWYLDENEEQPLQQSAAMDSSTLTALTAHYCGMQQAHAPLKQLLFPHTVLPIVVVMGRTSFVVVRCVDRFCPTTVVPTAAATHLSLKMLETQRNGEQGGHPSEKLHFMNGRSLWTYEPSERVCDETDGTLSLPAKATVCSTLERHEGPDGEYVLATACMEFGGGTRAAFFTPPSLEPRQRSCKDAALVDTSRWSGSQSPGAVAAVISEDGMSLNFEGSHAEATGCAGPHSIGSPVSRVFCTPFCNGAALLYVDAANYLRFSRNRSVRFSADGGLSAGAVAPSDWSDWSVWNDGPGLRLHGDESVISAAWQEGSESTGDAWLPVLALLTSRRAMLLSSHLEVMAHAEIEAGSPSPLGVPSGIWCGVVFLYTTSSQIRWLALDGTNSGLVSLPVLNATLCGVTQSSVVMLCPDGHRSFIHSIPIGLYEPLALGWIVASRVGQVSLTTAVQHIQSLSSEPGSEWTVSATLLKAIAELPVTKGRQAPTHSSEDEEAAMQILLQIGLAAAFSDRIGGQFPLEIRLLIALRCGAYRLGYEALRQEWVSQSEPSLAATSALGSLFEQLASACRGVGEPEIERQCRSVLCNHWDPLHSSSSTAPMVTPHQHDITMGDGDGPKGFADVLEMQAGRLPSAAPLPSSEFGPGHPVPLDKGSTLLSTAAAAAAAAAAATVSQLDGRRSWEGMTGVRVQAHGAGGSIRRSSGADASALQLDIMDDLDIPGPMHFSAPTSVAAPTTSNSTATSGSQYGSGGGGGSGGIGSLVPQPDDDSDEADSGDGVGALRSAGWEIERFSSSDDDDDREDTGAGGVVGRGRKITIEIKQPSATVSRSSVASVLEGATSIPLSSVGGSPGDDPARLGTGMRLAAPRTVSALAPPPPTRTSTFNK